MISRTWPVLAAVTIFGLFPTPAGAGFYSGAELYEVCTVKRGDKAYFEKAFECVAYVAGAVDAFNTTREAVKLKSCIPSGVTISKLRDVTVDYLDDNPNARKSSASAAVFAATRAAWPCEKPTAKPAAKKPAPKKGKAKPTPKKK